MNIVNFAKKLYSHTKNALKQYKYDKVHFGKNFADLSLKADFYNILNFSDASKINSIREKNT